MYLIQVRYRYKKSGLRPKCKFSAIMFAVQVLILKNYKQKSRAPCALDFHNTRSLCIALSEQGRISLVRFDGFIRQCYLNIIIAHSLKAVLSIIGTILTFQRIHSTEYLPAPTIIDFKTQLS
ncbi:hypothetical protein DBR32_07340 [Taibaiella sp. KBW10]|nr:hypothetical protein DBR32_07340 [Taibaiella sp. KBW10]